MTLKFIRRSLIFLPVFLLFTPEIHSQQSKIDSLKKVLAINSADTTRIMALAKLSVLYQLKNPDSSITMSEEGLKLAQQLKWPRGIAASKEGIALGYYRKGELEKAKDYSLASKLLWDSLQDNEGIAHTLSDLSLITTGIGDYPKALEYAFSSVKLERQLGDSAAVAKLSGNIGMIYADMKDYEKALEYDKQAIRMYTALGKESEVARNYGNMGVVYANQGFALIGTKDSVALASLIKNSIDNYKLSLVTAQKAGDLLLVGRQFGNIAINFWVLGKTDSAATFFNSALEMQLKNGDKTGYANTLGNMGEMYFEDGDFPKGEKYLLASLDSATAIGDAGDRKFALSILPQLYAKMGNYKAAYDYYGKYVSMKDSLFSDSKSKDIGRLEAKADYDKQQAVDEANHKKELEVAAEKEKQQIIISISAASGLLIVLIFSFFLVKRIRLTQRQKNIIEQQKIIVEEKQREIIDSIKYAKRIQQSQLPSEKMIGKNISRLREKSS
ncbi:MAG TPA: tetratricopeptide repeat protein [Bacteroidia bacterium]|jgi:tetratricopeptide (TPR) repeat protein|nr:tetratricopeptide repeat protein [Bacteroidia bacterium]